MEPLAIAIIGAVVFGVVATLAIFIRQLILSRDKTLNDKAHYKALELENKALEKMRHDLESNRRFDAHYQVLGANRDAIEYLDLKIDETLNKKFALIQRYSSMSLAASAAIIDGQLAQERKNVCDSLRTEIDSQLNAFDEELQELQKRRAKIWDAHLDLQSSLLDQEAKRNTELDRLYERHTSLLEKLYVRHNDNIDNIAEKNIEAGSKDFNFFLVPFQFLIQLFKLQFQPSPNISTNRFNEELESRKQVLKIQEQIIEDANTAESPAQVNDNLSAGDTAVDLIT